MQLTRLSRPAPAMRCRRRPQPCGMLPSGKCVTASVSKGVPGDAGSSSAALKRAVLARFQTSEAVQPKSIKPAGGPRVVVLGMEFTPECTETVRWATKHLIHDGDKVHMFHIAPEATSGHGGEAGLHHPEAVRVIGHHTDDAAAARAQAEGATLARRMLDEHAPTLARHQVDVEAHVQPLHRPLSKQAVAQALCGVAEELRASVVVLTSRCHGGIMGLLQGSVADYVIHHTSIPVAVLHPPPVHVSATAAAARHRATHSAAKAGGGRDLVVPVENQECSMAAVEWVLRHMYRPGDVMHLVHVVPCLPLSIPTTGSDFLMHPGFEADPAVLEAQEKVALEEVDAWRANVAPVFRKVLDEAGALYELDVRVQFTDDPAHNISGVVCSKAEAVGAEAVVMCHRSRPALVQHLMGSVTAGVVHHCASPIVVLHLNTGGNDPAAAAAAGAEGSDMEGEDDQPTPVAYTTSDEE